MGAVVGLFSVNFCPNLSYCPFLSKIMSMAVKSIATYVDQIEAGFGNKESPAAITKRLGIPEKAKTIAR
jgi:hypothetical protein